MRDVTPQLPISVLGVVLNEAQGRRTEYVEPHLHTHTPRGLVAVFWVVTPRSSEGAGRLVGTYRLHLQGGTVRWAKASRITR